MNMNPQQIVSMLISRNPNVKNNPIIQNAMQMAQNNDTKGLQTLTQNIAREKGVDLNALVKQIESNMRT